MFSESYVICFEHKTLAVNPCIVILEYVAWTCLLILQNGLVLRIAAAKVANGLFSRKWIYLPAGKIK